MNRAMWVRGAVVVAALLVCAPAFPIAYTSNGTGGGDWGLTSTWSPSGVPGATDTVTLTGPTP